MKETAESKLLQNMKSQLAALTKERKDAKQAEADKVAAAEQEARLARVVDARVRSMLRTDQRGATDFKQLQYEEPGND